MPEIEAFTELSDYLALPVRTYSSRHAGAARFRHRHRDRSGNPAARRRARRRRCAFCGTGCQRVKALIERSSIMVLASHSDKLIRQMCKRAILLDHGRLVADGPTEEVLEIYARMTRGEPPRNRCRRGREERGRRPGSLRLRSEHASRTAGIGNSRRATAVYQASQHREGTMSNLKHVKIFADGADLDGILALYKNPSIKGFTTNPTPHAQGRHRRLRSVRAATGGGDSRPPDLLRGLRRRFRRR